MILKTLRAHSLDLLRGFLPILVIVAFIEFALSRTTGRLSHLFQGGPAMSALYELGVLAVYGGNVIVLVCISLLAFAFIGSESLREKAYGLICFTMLPVALVLFAFSLPVSSVLVGLAVLFFFQGRGVGWYGILSASLLATSFITVSTSIYLGRFPVLQTLGESLVILVSLFLFMATRKMGRLNWWRWLISASIPVAILVVPHYSVSVMPWTLRQVTTFAVNFRFILPVELYAVALTLFLASILRVASRGGLLPHGLLLIFLGGLPQWNVYPLLLTTLGSLLVILSLSGWVPPPATVWQGFDTSSTSIGPLDSAVAKE